MSELDSMIVLGYAPGADASPFCFASPSYKRDGSAADLPCKRPCCTPPSRIWGSPSSSPPWPCVCGRVAPFFVCRGQDRHGPASVPQTLQAAVTSESPCDTCKAIVEDGKTEDAVHGEARRVEQRDCQAGGVQYVVSSCGPVILAQGGSEGLTPGRREEQA
eukprot:5615272-Prymnesium_polylepis.2